MPPSSYFPDKFLTGANAPTTASFFSAIILFMSITDTDKMDSNQSFSVGNWQVFPDTGRMECGTTSSSLDPKLMNLLLLLAKANGDVLSRKQIEDALWPDIIVGEDTLARTISRLRRAFGDSAQDPTYIETLPKRGYRLVKPVSFRPRPQQYKWGWTSEKLVAALVVIVLIVSAAAFVHLQATRNTTGSRLADLTARADNLYMQFTYKENEAAIALYEKAISMDENYAAAQSGLANALVQRVIRWPASSPENYSGSVQESLRLGMHQSAAGRGTLERATALAERAVRLAPGDADALKALGLAYAAENRIEEARSIYLRAVEINRDAWEAMINLSEIYEIQQDPHSGIQWLIQAYESMERVYHQEPQRVGSWQAAIGVLIGSKTEALGQNQDAEIWYRRALEVAPYEPEATSRLAALLRKSGDTMQANRLCSTLEEKFGPTQGCADQVDE